jgi:hypothetical protein
MCLCGPMCLKNQAPKLAVTSQTVVENIHPPIQRLLNFGQSLNLNLC